MKKKATKKAATKKATKKVAAPKKIAAPMIKKPAIKARVASRPGNTNSMAYTQSEFLENVRGFCGFEKRAQARELVDDLAQLVKDSLKRGYKIPLFGLGKMYVRQTKPRTGRNPATGAIIHIPARKRIRFTAAKALKEAVL